jgi:hypothetical protein
MTKKQFIPGIITLLILLFALAPADIKQVFGLSNDNRVLSVPNQTVPTRTATPGPTNTPAPKPTNSGGGGDSATAVPTSTTQALPTNTATPPVAIAYTPVGGFVPTAESCGSPPTIQVQNPTNVRQGPGINYSIVGQLVFLEVRFILGRAAYAAWWLIQLDDGDTGWVADDIVTVQGYIGGVPIVPAPAISGQTPTPGTPWNPTPLPFCTVTPTATPSATPEPTTAVAESTPVPAAAQTAAETAEPLPPTETLLPQPTQTAVAPPTLPPAAPTNQPEPAVIDAEQSAVTPVEASASGSAADWLLPIIGLLLIAGGAAAFVARRQT